MRNSQAHHRRAGAAHRARLADRRADARAEQPGRRGRRGPRPRCASGSPACGTSSACSPTARIDPAAAARAHPAAGVRHRTGRQGAEADRDRGQRPRGRAGRLARRARRHRRLGPRADPRPGAASTSTAWRRSQPASTPGAARPVAALARVRAGDRAADDRHRGRQRPDLDAGLGGQAVLAARPRLAPVDRRARRPGQHAGHAQPQDRRRDHGGQGVRPQPAADPGPRRPS